MQKKKKKKKTSAKRIKDKAQLDGKGDAPWNLLEIKIWPTTKWYMYKPETVLKNETRKIFWDFGIQMEHRIRQEDQTLY